MDEVVAVAQEALVLGDAHEHVQVAGRAAAVAGVAAPGDADALLVGDPGGDVDLRACAPAACARGRRTPSTGSRGSCRRRRRRRRPGCGRAGRTRCASRRAAGPGRRSARRSGSACPARRRCRGSARTRSTTSYSTSTEVPVAASSSEISTATAVSPPWTRAGAAAAERVAAAEERVEDVGERAEALEARLVPARGQAVVPVAVVDRARFSASERISCASASSLNFSSASGSCWLTSGCSSRAFARKAFLIARSSQSRGTSEHLVGVAFHL